MCSASSLDLFVHLAPLQLQWMAVPCQAGLIQWHSILLCTHHYSLHTGAAEHSLLSPWILPFVCCIHFVLTKLLSTSILPSVCQTVEKPPVLSATACRMIKSLAVEILYSSGPRMWMCDPSIAPTYYGNPTMAIFASKMLSCTNKKWQNRNTQVKYWNVEYMYLVTFNHCRSHILIGKCLKGRWSLSVACLFRF